jgi:cytochrome P450
MRMTPYIYRKVVRDLRLGSYRVPRGWLLRICVREAHHRPDVFPSPDAFEPSRFAARSFGPDEFCPFSAGPHACFADTFVMAVARTFLVHLALNYDERIARDGPVEGSNRHWTYGQPGAQLRVSLTPRGSPSSPASKLVPDDGATA